MEVILSCQFTSFTYYFFTHSSVWLLVVMTAEKTLAISFPVTAKVICTVKTARIVSCVTVLIWAIVEAQLFFIYKKFEDGLEVRCDFIYEKIQKYYTSFHSVMYSFLPVVLIMILNTVIIVQLIISKLKSANPGHKSALSKKAVSTAIMLLSVSVSFTLLTVPGVVVLIMKDILNVTVSQELWVWAAFSYYTNHSSNALLYTFLGPKFRREALKLLCRGRFETSVDHSSSFTSNKVGPSQTHETEC